MAKKIKEEKVVASEVVETPPAAPVAQATTAPAPKSGGGSSALKIGLGICLGCLILIIIVMVGIFVTGGLAIKNIGIPFLKKAASEIQKEGTLQKIQEGKKFLEQIPTQGTTQGQGGSEIQFKEETKIPDTFPKDFPIYPGAKVTKAVSTEALVKAGFLISLETLDSSEMVVSYYQKNLPLSGWPVSGIFGGIISAKKGDQTAVVTIAAKGTGKTEINIVLGSK